MSGDRPVWKFGPFELHVRERLLRRDGDCVAVSPKTFDLLIVLAGSPGSLLRKGELLDALWPDTYVTEANLTFHVGQLRKALGNWGDEWIKTVPKHGYRFIAPVHSGSVSEPLQTAGVATSSVGVQHVGRAEEKAALSRALDLARTGGKVVLVSGEPGVGKTTLIEDCLNEPHVRDCWLIGRGRCVELVGITEPYLPFIEALESLRATTESGLVSELMSEHAPTWHARMLPAPASKTTIVAESRDRMHRELASFLQSLSARRPVLLFLDDLHWSDPSTVDSLSFLSARIAGMRVVIGGAYRPADIHVSGHPFGRAYPSLLSKGSCEEIAVPPLTTEDVMVLVDAAFPENPHRAELAGFAYSRSECNPLFLIELLTSVPSGLQAGFQRGTTPLCARLGARVYTLGGSGADRERMGKRHARRWTGYRRSRARHRTDP